MYAGRLELKAIALDRLAPGGQLLNTLDIEDYPGFEHITGQELSEKMESHAKKFGLRSTTTTSRRSTRTAMRSSSRASSTSTAPPP